MAEIAASPPASAAPRAPSAVLVLVLLGLASGAKALWAWNSVGSYDAAMFYLFAKHLHTQSLASLYEAGPMFNHTPATACLIRALYELAGGNFQIFAGGLRLLCVVADGAVVFGLLRLQRQFALPPAWALAAFAVSPVSIMVSGFHGNVDPLMTALLFFAGSAAVWGSPIGCGLLLGGACNVKIVPILLIPIFLFFWNARGRRQALAFAVPLGVLLVAGYAWPLLQTPHAFVQHVFGYGGYWGSWGITYGLRLTGWHGFQYMDYSGLPPIESYVMLALKLLTIGAILALAWVRRRASPLAVFGTVAAAFTVMYVFAPGGAVQYMVWFAPFLLLDSPRWWLAATTGATVFLVAFYGVSAHGEPFPWFHVFPKAGDEAVWIPWSTVAWGTFAALLVARTRGCFAAEVARAQIEA